MSGPGDPFAAIAVFDDRVRTTTLPSGVRVVTDPTPGAVSAAVSVWVGVGSRDEPADAAGAFHFLEHLLFKGTQRRTAHEVNVAIDSVGGELNAFTSKELTAFFARVPATDVAMATDLLAELVLEPALDPEDVDAEREVILEELAMVVDTPDELAASLLDESVFVSHGLGWEVLGREETLEGMTLDVLAGIHDRWYRHGRLVVAAAGAVDHDALVEQVGERFAAPAADPPTRDVPGDDLRTTHHVERDSEQVHVAHGLARASRSTIATAGRSPSCCTPSATARPAASTARSATSAAWRTRSAPRLRRTATPAWCSCPTAPPPATSTRWPR